MQTLTHTSATDGQIKQIARVASDAAEKAVKDYKNFSKDSAQRVHGNPEFAVRVREATILALAELSVSDKFKDEEVESNYGYFSGYRKPKGITEQTNILRQLFPGVGFADEKLAERPVPANAEGWFAIPKWQTIAPTYTEAVEKVLAKINETRNGKFYNYREGKLGSDYLKQSAKTEKVFQTLGDEQKDHDILVVAAQFGIRHRGRSVRRACEVMQVNEYGLGAFAVGIMLLTHPERLMNYDDLHVNCAGDGYAPEADGVFSFAPFFNFDGDRVKFGAVWYGYANGRCGSSSAFLPQ
jgi:hypothetical protein